MHNLTKIKLFNILLWCTYPIALLVFYPWLYLRRKSRGDLIFFFDRYAIGGAQKVHLDILESVADIPKTVYFTRFSPNDKMKEQFYKFPATACHDIHVWCDYLLFRLFSVHYFAIQQNLLHVPVLGANSTFFYDLLPFLKPSVFTIELLHNFSFGKKGMEFFGLAHYRRLDARLVIDAATRNNILDQYRERNIPEQYSHKVQLVEYGVNIPEQLIPKPAIPPLKVLYAGRGGNQKRVWLLNDIIKRLSEKNIPVEFTFAGSMRADLSSFTRQCSRVYDEIGDPAHMARLFEEAHVIVLTSSFEGFPVVIKEGMSHGCVPVVTALPGNKIHLSQNINALLTDDYKNETAVVEKTVEYLSRLAAEPGLLESLSINAREYAVTHFGKQEFLRRYRRLLLQQSIA